MITQTNVCFGFEKPDEYMLADNGIRVNKNIRSEDVTIGGNEVRLWYADSTFIMESEDSYYPYKRMIELQATSDEQDELIAELIEGGAE